MKTKSKSKPVRIVKTVSKIIHPETKGFWFMNLRSLYFSDYFCVQYVYLNFPKTKSICPPSKKKSDKIYGQEVVKKEVKNVDYVYGRQQIITYNNKTYDLTNRIDFETLHHNLEVECALNNI